MFDRASLSWAAVVVRQDEGLVIQVVVEVALASLGRPYEVVVDRSCRVVVGHVQEVREDDHRDVDRQDVAHEVPSFPVAVDHPSLACHSDHNQVRPSSFRAVVHDRVVAAHEVHRAPLDRPCLEAFRAAACQADLQDLRSSLAVGCRRMDLKQRACPRSHYEVEERTSDDQVLPFR